MTKLLKVASKIETGSHKGKWNWVSRKFYKRYAKNRENFVEKENSLYLIEVNRDRLAKSLEGALKICGSAYALVLVLTDGDNTSNDFMRHHKNITKKVFRNGLDYLKMFEKIIKNFGVNIGTIDENGKVSWISEEINHLEIKIKSIKDIYGVDKTKFYTIDNNLFYLRPLTVQVEDMFWRASAIAGGEYALALALSDGNEKLKNTHYRNLQRLGFKQGRTFYRYANLFSSYLHKNRPLFEVDYDESA